MASSTAARVAGKEAEAPPGASEASEDGGVVIGGRREALSDNYPAGRGGRVAEAACESDRLSARVTVRFSAPERAAINARGAALGVKPGAWLRALARDGLNARRDEVERLHRAAARRPDPARAALVEQLRRAGSVLWRERRRDELAVKLLTEIRDLLRVGGQLDEKRTIALDEALAALTDPGREKALAPVIAAVEALRADAGDRTRL
ncbi:hypothetical protein MWU77_03135 [Rhodococcus sp. F64268]|uniref:hypothetical protein n=1 Tax=Rhodococcus sp. F64268 TaxID=2926402 RepID=UPI001FF5B8D2|nr:hypothetical protein [Rhodococcus sp. F64268]MCK0089772.1 hypothetical protein [Rhodococcus sp. F64268]